MAELVSKVYSDALFEAAVDLQRIDQIYEEFSLVCKEVEANPEILELWLAPEVSTIQKKTMFADIFGAHVGEETQNFMKVLLDKQRIADLLSIKSAFDARYYAHKKLSHAIVESAVPVSEADLETLRERLSKMSQTEVAIRNVIVPEVVGGLVVRLGDKIIDGSVRRRISELKEELAQMIV